MERIWPNKKYDAERFSANIPQCALFHLLSDQVRPCVTRKTQSDRAIAVGFRRSGSGNVLLGLCGLEYSDNVPRTKFWPLR
jgi:hypothetical protein